MTFNVGNRVRLTETRHYSDGTVIEAGRRGTVRKVYPLSESYRIEFDGDARQRRVSERFLAAA